MFRRAFIPLLPLALLLAACQDRELPTALAPEGALFDHVGTSYVVMNTDDSGEGSLRYGIEHVEPGGTITFTAALNGQTITLTSGQLTITKDLTISGPGADLLTVARSSTADRFRIFDINSGVTVSISGLTIRGGETREGGGIDNRGTLTLTHSTVSGNRAQEGGGGGILNWGTLTLTHSTVVDNSGGGGGGIFNLGAVTLTHSTVSGNSAGEASSGGGIANLVGTLTLIQSTVSGSTAGYQGGGIWNGSFGTLTLTNSTVSGNRGAWGGGIFSWGSLTITQSTVTGNRTVSFGAGISNHGTAMLRNTIVANSASGVNCWSDYPIIDDGYNLDSGSTCGFTAVTSLSNTDPQLEDLAPNAPGTTATHALLPGSPAIDAGSCTDHEGTTVTTDQRGVDRPQGRKCDVGAFELEQASTPIFGGFLPPVRTDVLNVVKAGRAVPIQFSLGNDFGLNIFAEGYPKSVPVARSGCASEGTDVPTTTAGKSGLSYDEATDTYTYIWKSETGWAGTCRRFEVQFVGDEELNTLDFSFTR